MIDMVNVSDRIITYIDILGFKNFIDNCSAEVLQNFFTRIDFLTMEPIYSGKLDEQGNTINEFYGIKEKADSARSLGTHLINEITLNLFSDTIVFSYEYSDDALYAAIFKVSNLQSILLSEFQLHIRGSITVGKLILYKYMITGMGLYKAYKLEEKAEFPRVIIDPSKIPLKILTSLYDQQTLAKEEDFFFINYLSLLNGVHVPESDKEKLKNGYITCFSQLCNQYLELPKEKQEKTLRKIEWLINYGNWFNMDLQPIFSKTICDWNRILHKSKPEKYNLKYSFQEINI